MHTSALLQEVEAHDQYLVRLAVLRHHLSHGRDNVERVLQTGEQRRMGSNAPQ